MSRWDVISALLCWAGVDEETSAKNLLTFYSSLHPRPVSREVDKSWPDLQQQLAISCLWGRRRYVVEAPAPAAEGGGCVKKKSEMGEGVGGPSFLWPRGPEKKPAQPNVDGLLSFFRSFVLDQTG